MNDCHAGPFSVNIVKELGGLLLDVEKPGRYTGGEFGRRLDDRLDNHHKKNASLRALIAFPDLYEIGMGNLALRIIYNRLNDMEDILCDRAFAPAPDFEKLLREKNIPIYGLDTGISFNSLDVLMFTLGYELGLTGILAMLDVSKIPLRSADRGQDHPVIIAGGPAVSNPLPYSLYIDAFWIGEAEAGFFELMAELSRLKKIGQGRAALLETLCAHPNIWTRGKEKAFRAIAADFANDNVREAEQRGAPPQCGAVLPVPSMKTVHNHGMIEIMRGCPNGCRFCHAGYWYRPMRQKSHSLVFQQAKENVNPGGWRQISLSSLSSGDYNGVGELVENLNQMFASRHVSFQMPSLRVSGFSLSLLEKISATRKSGLTFAVETPLDAWQMAINKEVTRNSVAEILLEAKKRGWKTAKFYFMIGLPIKETEEDEEKEIVNFITDIARRTRMHFNINVGLFIPKPHTPYQCEKQLNCVTAAEKFNFIKSKLKPLGHKVSVSDLLISRLEGIMSRGDERAGLLAEEAYRGGSRLDAWSEFINREKWQEILEKNSNYIDVIFSGKIDPMPWSQIDSCVSDEYIKNELEKSNNFRRTETCNEKCTLCGVCGENIKLQKTDFSKYKNIFVNHNEPAVNDDNQQNRCDPSIYRMLYSFSKHSSAVFHGHLSLIEIFSMAFTRADIPVLYTGGFNPLARIEFASPLATGIGGSGEFAIADFICNIEPDDFINRLNANFPEGICIEKAELFHIPGGVKKHSLSSLLWGFQYSNGDTSDYVPFANEKKYRQERLGVDLSKSDFPKSLLFSLRRDAVLAKNIIGASETEWVSYFDAYRKLYA